MTYPFNVLEHLGEKESHTELLFRRIYGINRDHDMYLRYFRPIKSISRVFFTQRNSTAIMNDSGTFPPAITLDPQPFAELWYPLLQQTMTETEFLTLLVDVRKVHRTHGLKEMATMVFNQSIFSSSKQLHHNDHRREDREQSMAIIFAQILRLVAALLREDSGVSLHDSGVSVHDKSVVHDKARYECVKTLLVAVEAVGITPPPPPVADVAMSTTGSGDYTVSDGSRGASITAAAITAASATAATTTTALNHRYPPKPPKPSLHQFRQGPSLLSTLPPHPLILQGSLPSYPHALITQTFTYLR